MIRKWRLENFKSIYDKVELDLKPLTVFAGANSSGKSTFIQSMLLVWQTLNNQVYSRPIILNGHIIRLGTYNDLASAGSDCKHVSIGFQMDPTHQPPLSYRSVPQFHKVRQRIRIGRHVFDSINCDFFFTAKDDFKDISQLQPLLEYAKLSCKRESEQQRVTVEIRRIPDKVAKILDKYGIQVEDLTYEVLSTLQYEITKGQSLVFKPRRFSFDTAKKGEVVGGWFTHFLPLSFTVVYDTVEERAERIIREFRDATTPSRRKKFPFSEDDLPFLSQEFMKKMNDIFQDYSSNLPESYLAPRKNRITQIAEQLKKEFDIEKLLDAFSIMDRLRRYESLRQNRTELLRLCIADKEPQKALARRGLPDDITDATNFIRRFFNESFKYLGPLRDEPKAVYPMPGAVEPTDIGLRGEFTAAVLDLHKNTTVGYLPSNCFDEKGCTFETEQTTLLIAVLDWLRYMGVVEDVQTKDLGLYGHELKVRPQANDTLHNLTHVGVGVSQVLPILVMSLLTKPGSTLVFEQPEIHLHPRVQSRLADFLLSMSLTGRQCIVETHSEYLINRLRYRTAIAEETNVANMVGIYFVEKKNGKSYYRSINVNEYGAITDWPEGFFDQSQNESERILMAAMNKRKRLREKDNE